MKTSTTTTFLILALSGLVLGIAGCAAETSEDVSLSEAELSQKTRLDLVTPAEVAKTFADDVAPLIARCAKQNPSIASVDKENLSTFAYANGIPSAEVFEVLTGLLSEPEVTTIPVAELAARVGPWAERQMRLYVDAAGNYTPPKRGLVTFYDAEVKTREVKALSLAKAPGGRSLKDIRELWRNVENDNSLEDFAWLNPVAVRSSSPSVGDVRQAMKIDRRARVITRGPEALARFVEELDKPDYSRDSATLFRPIEDILKGSAIKRSWLFAGGGEDWSTQVLVVLDVQNQLWGFRLGWSE